MNDKNPSLPNIYSPVHYVTDPFDPIQKGACTHVMT